MSAQAGRSLYESLGLPPNAQKQDIKNAYRRLALRYHPDKNQEDLSAKVLFQEIQAAYETLSEDDERARYDIAAGYIGANRSARTWKEPSYGPCPTPIQDPPFWSVELRAMTIQKCARTTKIQHLEREIRQLILDLENLIAAEHRAASKEKKTPNRFSFTKSRASKQHAQRHRDFLAQSARLNAHLHNLKDDLRTAHEDHRKILERDNERKTWWARERVRRVEEENRKAATMAADAARRRAERAREHRNREPEAAQAADDEWRQEREDAARRAQAARAEEERRKREMRARGDPEEVAWRRREAQEWVARQREASVGTRM